jgi:hypothetical protein
VKDTATSFKYLTILEADMARQREREASAQKQRSHSTSDSSNNTRGRSEAVKTIANGGQKPDARQQSETVEVKTTDTADGGEASRVEPKGKRKVTFDVKADAVNASKEVAPEENGGDDAAQPAPAAGETLDCYPGIDKLTLVFPRLDFRH